MSLRRLDAGTPITVSLYIADSVVHLSDGAATRTGNLRRFGKPQAIRLDSAKGWAPQAGSFFSLVYRAWNARCRCLMSVGLTSGCKDRAVVANARDLAEVLLLEFGVEAPAIRSFYEEPDRAAYRVKHQGAPLVVRGSRHSGRSSEWRAMLKSFVQSDISTSSNLSRRWTAARSLSARVAASSSPCSSTVPAHPVVEPRYVVWLLPWQRLDR